MTPDMDCYLVNEFACEQRAQEGEAEPESKLSDELLARLSRTNCERLLMPSPCLAQLIAAGVETETLNRAIGVIIRNAKAQERIISDLYVASSILSGKFSMALKLLNLSKMVAEEVETVLPAAANKKVHLKQHLADINLAVYADEGRLRQVIWNLLNNAVKFTPESGSVVVWCGEKDSAAQITVSDTGCGIKPEILSRIFERSFQAGCGNGLGLGLSIARHIVEQHNGSISAASRGDDQGSTFTVRMPISKVV